MTPQPDTSETPWTMGRLLSWTADYLARHDVEDARLASEVLLAHATHRSRIDLYARFEEVPAEEDLRRFREWVRRAGNQEPIAYLVGEKEFFSLPFAVTPDVLIPRPETETLVQCVVDYSRQQDRRRLHLLDLGTGSGCIAVTVLKQLPAVEVVASDRSSAALEVARSNAERHGVADRLTLVEADRLNLPPSVIPPGGFDVLMSNPPYVPADEISKLDATVRDYEPSLALTDSDDGLSFYRTIADRAGEVLSQAGVVFVEIGIGQAPAVIETMAPTLVHRGTWKDQVVAEERVLMFSRRDATHGS